MTTAAPGEKSIGMLVIRKNDDESSFETIASGTAVPIGLNIRRAGSP